MNETQTQEHTGEPLRRGTSAVRILHQPTHFPALVRLNLVLTHKIPPAFCEDIFLFIPSTAIGSLPDVSGSKIEYRWCSLPRIRRHGASSRQGSSSNRRCRFSNHHGPFFVCLPFPTSAVGTVECTIQNASEACMEREESLIVIIIFSLVVEKERTYAGRDGRIYIARQNSQAARTGMEKCILYVFS